MELTSKERLMRIFRKQETDRPAIKLWGSWQYKEGDHLMHPAYEPVAKLASETTDLFTYCRSPFNIYCGRFCKDLITTEVKDTKESTWKDHITTYHTPYGDLRQIKHVSTVGDPGYTTEYAVKEPEDLKKILAMAYEPYKYEDNLVICEDALGDRGVVMFNLDHASYSVQRLMGSENLAIFSYDCHDLIDEACSIYAKRLYAHAKEALHAGVKVPFSWVGPELLTPPLMTDQGFNDFCYKYDKPLCEIIHNGGSYVWMHCHGKVRKLLDRYIDMGIDILNPLEPPKNGDIDMKEVVAKYGSRIGLEGNIEMQELIQASPERLRMLIRECVEAGSAGGRFILCPSSGFMEYTHPSQEYIDNLRIYLTYGLQCVRSVKGSKI